MTPERQQEIRRHHADRLLSKLKDLSVAMPANGTYDCNPFIRRQRIMDCIHQISDMLLLEKEGL